MVDKDMVETLPFLLLQKKKHPEVLLLKKGRGRSAPNVSENDVAGTGIVVDVGAGSTAGSIDAIGMGGEIIE